MADVVAERADVRDVVVEPLQLQQDGPDPLRLERNDESVRILDGPAERERVAHGRIPADPLGQLDALRGTPALEEPFDAPMDEPQARLEVQDRLADDGEPEMARADHSGVHRSDRDLVHPGTFDGAERVGAVDIAEGRWITG